MMNGQESLIPLDLHWNSCAQLQQLNTKRTGKLVQFPVIPKRFLLSSGLLTTSLIEMDADLEYSGTPGTQNSYGSYCPHAALLAAIKPRILFSEIMYHPGSLQLHESHLLIPNTS